MTAVRAADVGSRVLTRQRSADATLHATAMVLMIAGMLVPVVWTPLLLGGLWGAQAVGAVLLRRGWRVRGSFVDLIAVSASLAVPFAVGHGHDGPAGSAATALAVVVSAWVCARWWVGVRGRAEWVGFVAMGVSMVVMLAIHIATAW